MGGNRARWGGHWRPPPGVPPVFLGRFVMGRPRGSAAALHNAVLCRELGFGWHRGTGGGVTGHTELRPIPVAEPQNPEGSRSGRLPAALWDVRVDPGALPQTPGLLPRKAPVEHPQKCFKHPQNALNTPKTPAACASTGSETCSELRREDFCLALPAASGSPSPGLGWQRARRQPRGAEAA